MRGGWGGGVNGGTVVAAEGMGDKMESMEMNGGENGGMEMNGGQSGDIGMNGGQNGIGMNEWGTKWSQWR